MGVAKYIQSIHNSCRFNIDRNYIGRRDIERESERERAREREREGESCL